MFSGSLHSMRSDLSFILGFWVIPVFSMFSMVNLSSNSVSVLFTDGILFCYEGIMNFIYIVLGFFNRRITMSPFHFTNKTILKWTHRFPHNFVRRLQTTDVRMWLYSTLCVSVFSLGFLSLPPSACWDTLFILLGPWIRIKWVKDHDWLNSLSCHLRRVYVIPLQRVLPLQAESIRFISVQFNFHSAPLWSVSIMLGLCGRCVCFTSESRLSADTVRQLQTDSLQ